MKVKMQYAYMLNSPQCRTPVASQATNNIYPFSFDTSLEPFVTLFQVKIYSSLLGLSSRIQLFCFLPRPNFLT